MTAQRKEVTDEQVTDLRIVQRVVALAPPPALSFAPVRHAARTRPRRARSDPHGNDAGNTRAGAGAAAARRRRARHAYGRRARRACVLPPPLSLGYRRSRDDCYRRRRCPGGSRHAPDARPASDPEDAATAAAAVRGAGPARDDRRAPDRPLQLPEPTRVPGGACHGVALAAS